MTVSAAAGIYSVRASTYQIVHPTIAVIDSHDLRKAVYVGPDVLVHVLGPASGMDLLHVVWNGWRGMMFACDLRNYAEPISAQECAALDLAA